jgi:PAS domain S-box-containing protein
MVGYRMRESVAPSEQSESERRFRDLFDNAPVGYHEVDKDGRYVRVNRTEASMLGYEPEEMVGRYAWDFVVEGDRDG